MCLLYDKDGNKTDLEQQKTYCGNPACLGEHWCSVWDLCKVYNMLHVLQEVTELESSTSPLSDLQISTLPTVLPGTLPMTSLTSPMPFNPHSAPSTNIQTNMKTVIQEFSTLTHLQSKFIFIIRLACICCNHPAVIASPST